MSQRRHPTVKDPRGWTIGKYEKSNTTRFFRHWKTSRRLRKHIGVEEPLTDKPLTD